MQVYCLEYPQKKIIKSFKKKISFSKDFKAQKIPTNAEIVYCKLNYFIDKRIIPLNSKIKFLLSPTTSTNHIDLNYMRKKKVKIINLNPNDKKIKSITSTGEYALTLILSSIRKLFLFSSTNSKFNLNDRYLYDVFQFKKYTVGIIGKGRVGTYLFKQLKNLGFKVISYDKNKDLKTKLNKVLNHSDIISASIDSKDNYNFFDKKKFNLMKKNVIFINTSRGEIVNEKDLSIFLKKNKNSYAILDVIKNEQNKSKKNLLLEHQKKYKNLKIFPHLGGSTKDAMEIADEYILRKLINIYEKKN